MNSLRSIQELPLIGILRGFTSGQLEGIIPAVTRGSLRNLEITMNSPDALTQIRQARECSGLNVGAGTVTSIELLGQALGAGAGFIVTPTLNLEVVRECVRQRVPVLPGAFSPTEVVEAWEAGATLVKIFPADTGGAAYIRALRGPFPQIGLLPTGGVDLRTASEFLKAGATGLGVGSPLFDKKRIEARDWSWLEEQTSSFVRLFAS